MYTLDQLLKADIIAGYRFLSPDKSLSKRRIDSIGVTREADFARKNELVLAPGSWDETEEALLDYVSELSKQGACALILCNIEETILLSKKGAEQLAAYNIPVIQIPWGCRYADLQQFVFSRILEQETETAHHYETLQQDLLNAYVCEQGLDDAASIIAKRLKCHCGIFNISGQRIGTSSLAIPAQAKKVDPQSYRSVLIKNADQHYGTLYLEKAISIDTLLLERYLIPPLILWFNKEQLILSARQAELDEFIWSIARNEPENEEEMIHQGELLGFNLLLPYSCAVGELSLDSQNDADYRKSWIASNITSIKEHILQLAASINKRILLTYQQETLLLYIECTAPDTKLDVDLFLNRVENTLSKVYPHLYFRWGVCETNKSVGGFHDNYLHARSALDLCPHIHGESGRLFYKSTALFSILDTLSNNQQTRNLVKEIIRPILDYDEENLSDLFHTLQVYLETNSLSEASRLLHLHRQSLIYRLNKIESLIGLPLKDINNRFVLEVAIRLFS